MICVEDYKDLQKEKAEVGQTQVKLLNLINGSIDLEIVTE